MTFIQSGSLIRSPSTKKTIILLLKHIVKVRNVSLDTYVWCLNRRAAPRSLIRIYEVIES